MQESSDLSPNFFQCPNILVDKFFKDLSGSELKCYLAIIRKTTGWHKKEDRISISQFMELTGLSNRSVIDACTKLESLGLIVIYKSEFGDKSFSLLNPNEITASEKSSPREKSSQGGVKKVHRGSEKSSQVASEKSSHTKDTLTKDTIQKTLLQNKGDLCLRFDEFWKEYPLKTAKQNALKAWQKLKPNESLFNKIMEAVKNQKNWEQWKSGFIPHAATFLNTKRWEDEEPLRKTQSTNRPKHVSEMTEAEVRANQARVAEAAKKVLFGDDDCIEGVSRHV